MKIPLKYWRSFIIAIYSPYGCFERRTPKVTFLFFNRGYNNFGFFIVIL